MPLYNCHYIRQKLVNSCICIHRRYITTFLENTNKFLEQEENMFIIPLQQLLRAKTVNTLRKLRCHSMMRHITSTKLPKNSRHLLRKSCTSLVSRRGNSSPNCASAECHPYPLFREQKILKNPCNIPRRTRV